MYDPQSSADRKILARAILDLMARSVFVEVARPGTKERVFAREVPESNGKIRLLVYTSIEGSEVRECGEDAIRACAVYTARDGRERGIASAEKRVNRVGDISAITDRLIERMREVWRLVKTAEKCPQCGAPMFKAKSGNLCCADLCWKKAEDLNRPYQGQNRRSWGGYRHSYGY